MKKILVSLAAISFIGGTASPAASNKTFLATRPMGVNLAMEGTTWHTQINLPDDNKDKFGGSLQVVGFYQENTNEEDLGKYFGFNSERTLFVGRNGDAGVDIDKRQLLHDSQASRNADPVSTNFTGSINLDMKHEAAGIRIDYYQGLDGLIKGLYFKVRAPIIWQENTSNLGLTGSLTATINADQDGTTNAVTRGINHYFSGNLTQTAGSIYSDEQSALTHAKIVGSDSNTSLADIDIVLGWNFWEEKKNHSGLNLGITIPTSNTPKGEYIFEAQTGNRGHWGLGAGFDTKISLWKNEDQVLEFDAVLDWRYLFEDTEKRTLGLKGKNWGQYFMIGTIGTAGVLPAANILTQNLDVRPGNQIDSRFGLAYRTSGFTADLGYGLYARESERVKIKDSFNESLYGYAGDDYNAITAFATTDIPVASVTIGNTQPGNASGTTLVTSDLDVEPATTPSIVTHKVYGGLGWAWNKWSTPVMIGVGGAYEFATKQEAPENWMLWGKLGISV